jgi:hypothetical protein
LQVAGDDNQRRRSVVGALGACFRDGGPSRKPSLGEPPFLAIYANIEFPLVTTLDDLAETVPAIDVALDDDSWGWLDRNSTRAILPRRL